MGKYLYLQCKRSARFLPGAFLAAIILLGALTAAFMLFNRQSANDASNQQIPLAICGSTDDSFIQMGLAALDSFDSSRFALDILTMDEASAKKALSQGQISAYVVIPEGFIDNALGGVILPISFVTAQGAGGLVPLMKEELCNMVSNLLVYSQMGVYGMWDAMMDNDLSTKLPGQMDQLALKYVDYIFLRDRIYSMQELGIADALSLSEYLLSGLGVLFVLLITLPFAMLLIPGDPALGRLLRAKHKSTFMQGLCDFSAYALTLLFLFCALFAGAGLVAGQVSVFAALWQLVPVILMAAGLSFMLYSLSRDLVGGILLQLFVCLCLCFISGCMYPVYFFPVPLQQLAQWLPAGIARTHISGFVTGNTPSWTAPALLGLCICFVCIGILSRIRSIKEIR